MSKKKNSKKSKEEAESVVKWIIGLIFVVYIGFKFGLAIGVFVGLVLGSLFKIVENTSKKK